MFYITKSVTWSSLTVLFAIAGLLIWFYAFACFAGLWNLVFLFSNISLVFLMPFAYFFTESEGFVGSKKVIMNALNYLPIDLLS